MSIEIPMKREGSHLVPVDAVSEEMLAEVPTNTGVMVTVKVPRNLRQFRLAWVLADIVAKSVDFLSDREAAMDWIKIKARHVRMIHDPLRNVTAIVPKSISFEKLDQVGFNRVFNRMIFVVTTEIIPGLDEGTLRAELESIVGIDPKPETAAPKPRAPRAKKSDGNPPHAEPPSDPQQEVQETAGAGEGMEPESQPSKPAAPADEAEYIAACRSWLKKQPDRLPAFDYFNSEIHRKMRQDLKVSTTARKQMEREIGEYFDAKDKAKSGKAATQASG